MLVIGERINSSIRSIEQAILQKDAAFIRSEVSNQLKAGADIIDLNAGTFIKSEADELIWLINTVKDLPEFKTNATIAIDCSNHKVLQPALEELTKMELAKKPMINSVTAESDKLDLILPLAEKYNSQLVGLCMDSDGIPDNPKIRIELGLKIIETAEKFNLSKTDIYIDPLVFPISTNINKGLQVIKTIEQLKIEDPECLTVIGLSNISYGLPMRDLLNRTFIVMALMVGLDAALMNPLDKKLMSTIKATETLMGKDNYCMNYIKSFRDNELE